MKQKRLLRIMSFVLAFIMLLEIGPIHVFATEKPPEEEVPEIPLPEITAPEPVTEMPEVYIEGEVQELRNEYEKHYRLTDGSFMAVQYQVPVHYEDEGQWVDIDNTLEPVTMFSGDTVYQAVNGENVQAFATDLSNGTIMTMATDDHMISMSIWTYDSTEDAVVEDETDNSVIVEDDTIETEPAATQESVPEEPADSAEATEESNPDNDLVGNVALAEEEWTVMADVSLDAAENIQEDAAVEELNCRMAEYTKAVIDGRPNFHISVVRDISPKCDCHGANDVPILPDVGMFASFDPIALDQACVDACLKNSPLPNSFLSDNMLKEDFVDYKDHFINAHPDSEYQTCLAHGEKIGIGSREYEIVTIK